LTKLENKFLGFHLDGTVATAIKKIFYYKDLDTEDFILRPVNSDDDDK